MNAARWSLLSWFMDLGILTAALFLSNWAKWTLPFGLVPNPGTIFVTPLTLGIILVAWSFFGRLAGLYCPRQPATLGQELQRVFSTLALTLIVIALVLFALKYYDFSRLVLMYFFASALLLLGAARLAVWKSIFELPQCTPF